MPLFPVGEPISEYYTKPQWFVGRVSPLHERKVADILSKMADVECFLPVRIERHKWSDRMKNVEVVLTPGYVFVRCRQSRLRQLLSDIPDLKSFLYNRREKRSDTIPEKQMELFRLMVEYEDRDIVVDTTKFSVGDHVRVILGPLAGHECDLVEINGTHCIAVNLGLLGSARIEMPLKQVERISGPVKGK